MSSDNEKLHHEGSSGRRVFLGRLAAGAAAGAGLLGLASNALAVPGPDAAGGATLGGSDPELWLEKLTGKHKQMVDAYNSNDGWPLGFTHTFLASQAQGQAGAVLVLRHFAMPMALNHDLWARYKIGTALKIPDPATKQLATRNPFFKPAPGVLLADDMALDRLISRGVIVGACNVALTVLSGMFAANAGVTKDKALAEWKAGIIPGITVIPSGTWGVNRAQERGCTYCTGGG